MIFKQLTEKCVPVPLPKLGDPEKKERDEENVLDYNINAILFHSSGLCLALHKGPILNITALCWCVCKGSASSVQELRLLNIHIHLC